MPVCFSPLPLRLSASPREPFPFASRAICYSQNASGEIRPPRAIRVRSRRRAQRANGAAPPYRQNHYPSAGCLLGVRGGTRSALQARRQAAHRDAQVRHREVSPLPRGRSVQSLPPGRDRAQSSRARLPQVGVRRPLGTSRRRRRRHRDDAGLMVDRARDAGRKQRGQEHCRRDAFGNEPPRTGQRPGNRMAERRRPLPHGRRLQRSGLLRALLEIQLRLRRQFRRLRSPLPGHAAVLLLRHAVGCRRVVHRFPAGRPSLRERGRERSIPPEASRDHGEFRRRARSERFQCASPHRRRARGAGLVFPDEERHAATAAHRPRVPLSLRPLRQHRQ